MRFRDLNQKFVSAELRDGSVAEGYLINEDPESGNVILACESPASDSWHVFVAMRHAIKQISRSGSGKQRFSDIFHNTKAIEASRSKIDSSERLCHACRLLRDGFVPFSVESEDEVIVVLDGLARISRPYARECIQCRNEIVLARLRTMLFVGQSSDFVDVEDGPAPTSYCHENCITDPHILIPAEIGVEFGRDGSKSIRISDVFLADSLPVRAAPPRIAAGAFCFAMHPQLETPSVGTILDSSPVLADPHGDIVHVKFSTLGDVYPLSVGSLLSVSPSEQFLTSWEQDAGKLPDPAPFLRRTADNCRRSGVFETVCEDGIHCGTDEEVEDAPAVPVVAKKRRRGRGAVDASVPNPFPDVLDKYWYQRYRYFGRYDMGIKMDPVSWFSVTPEAIASHIAERCRSSVVVDGFCGCGANAIQFAMTCERVIAIDINPDRVAMARHNARLYQVEDRIEFIVGDFLALLPALKADVIFLAPPWGGTEYASSEQFSLEAIRVSECDGVQLLKNTLKQCSNVAYYLPRHTNKEQFAAIVSGGQYCELERNFLNFKLKSITAYFGDLCREES